MVVVWVVVVVLILFVLLVVMVVAVVLVVLLLFVRGGGGDASLINPTSCDPPLRDLGGSCRCCCCRDNKRCISERRGENYTFVIYSGNAGMGAGCRLATTNYRNARIPGLE